MSTGPERPTSKVSWKPERPRSLCVTVAPESASVMSTEGGTAMLGPTSKPR